MEKLIAIDIDGTLRHSDGSITNRTKKIIHLLQEKSNFVVIASARPRYHALKIGRELGLNYIISSNGAEIYDIANKKVFYGFYLPCDVCKKVYNETREIGIRTIYVSENIEYATNFTRNNSQILLSDENIEEIYNNKIKQIMVIGTEKDKIINYKNKLNETLNIIDSSTNKEEIHFSIISENASKGNALIYLSKKLKVNKTIAIGNDDNDISMIKVANIGVAVKNSSKKLLENADKIIESNDNDGVAKFLESLV